jgi:hypothetical protein
MAAHKAQGRARVDPEAAFAFYVSLPLERRTYQIVADEFGLSARTVERYGRDGGWRERIRAIEAKAHARFDEQLADDRAKRVDDVKRLIDASFITYAQQLQSGDVRFTPTGFVSVVKLLLEQLDPPSNRTDIDADEATVPRSLTEKLEILGALRDAGAFDTLNSTLETLQ